MRVTDTWQGCLLPVEAHKVMRFLQDAEPLLIVAELQRTFYIWKLHHLGIQQTCHATDLSTYGGSHSCVYICAPN